MHYRIILTPWLKPIMSIAVPNWLAITLGSTILAARPLTERELAHELAHVEQWQHYGIAFVGHYVAASWSAWRAGGHWYRDNRFEVDAREVANLVD